MKRLVLGLMLVVMSLGWVGLSEAGGRGKGHRGHGGGHHRGYSGGHDYHHYYRHGHHDYYWESLLLYSAPYLLSLLSPYPGRVPVAAPPVTTGYVEQTGYWYYCTDPEGYHPYVRDCPGGWMQVVPSGPPR